MSVPLSMDPNAVEADKKSSGITARPNETDAMGIKAVNDPHNKRMDLTTPEQAAEDATISARLKKRGGGPGGRGLNFALPGFPYRRNSKRASLQADRPAPPPPTTGEDGKMPKDAKKPKRSLSQRVKGVFGGGKKQ